METAANLRPCWATVVEAGVADEAWVELESGSIVPIDASPDMLDLLEAGSSVLVDVDASGQAVPWSTVVVTRTEPDVALRASGLAEALPVAGQSGARELDNPGVRDHLADRPRTGMMAA